VTELGAGASDLHVLAYGELASGVTDSLRLGTFREPLAKLGVEVRSWRSFADDALVATAGAAAAAGSPDSDVRGRALQARHPDEALLRESGLTALAWADVILFRRWRPTRTVCTDCETAFGSMAELERHVHGSGHRTVVPDLLLRPVVELLETHTELLSSRAIVYDTDDDVLEYPQWTGFARAAARERELILRVLGLADLVTVATPVLAERLALHTRARIRVVRNALDPMWYEQADGASVVDAAVPGAEEPGLVRVVYHGVPVRLRDYEIARPGVDAVARHLPGFRRIWLGASEEPRIEAAMDEVRPWVDGLPEFAASLVATRPDIGLAPLRDEPFNRAKSELHWVEYSMAGAASIVSGFSGGGPYDVVRDGIDGLVVRQPGDWEKHLRSLAGSAALRHEIAGRARERVVAEYSTSVRAREWDDAYRWAADHPGFGRKAAARVAGAAAASDPGPSGRSPTRVLVLGPGAGSASDALRFVAMAPALAAHAVDLTCWAPADVPDPAAEFDMLEAALSLADVLVLRRSYRTYHSCLNCAIRTLDRAAIRDHARSAKHEVVESPFALVRPLVALLEAEPGVLGGRAIVYDTDDDIFSAELPPGAEDLLERDLVERIVALADLVTTTTPVLAERLRPRSNSVRVLRNALDPDWYRRDPADPKAEGEVRVVHHGSAARLPEYEVAREAVDSIAAEAKLHRIWLGSTDRRVAQAVDEVRPWVAGLPEFAHALSAVRADIGVAPLRDSAYNRCRSELHWLEYSLAGAATVASGFDGPGPYDPIRHGVDGLIARDPAEWRLHLSALAGSADLRAEMAGRARERVLADYSIAKRAAEWAEAYRGALERPLRRS
jgi:glycosyltransferase involved in cell wall biosynthesis